MNRLASQFILTALVFVWMQSATLAAVVETNAVTKLTPVTAPSLTESLIRLIGGMCVVLGLFLGGVWLMKRTPQLLRKGGDTRKLQVLEARSLGPRQVVYVVGYEQQRMLLATTPNGIQLLTHLPAAEPTPPGEVPPTPSKPTFAEALMQAVRRPS